MREAGPIARRSDVTPATIGRRAVAAGRSNIGERLREVGIRCRANQCRRSPHRRPMERLRQAPTRHSGVGVHSERNPAEVPFAVSLALGQRLAVERRCYAADLQLDAGQ